jgi:hypothetical protein
MRTSGPDLTASRSTAADISPAINMAGLWVLTFQVRPPGARAFSVVVRDQVR